MNDNDLLPASPKARAILAALSALEEAGMEATIRFEWNASPPAWIDIKLANADAAQLSDLLPNEARAILESRHLMADAGMDIVLQVDRTPFYIGIQLPTFPDQIRLAAKEEIRLAVVAALEYQLALGEADIAITQAKAHTPDAPGQEKKHA